MAKEAPLYDLMLLLSTSAEDEQRKKILADVESSISGAGGSIERNDDWGERQMAYEIRHQPAADYHLLQFKAPPTLIEELSHTLRITDGVRALPRDQGAPRDPGRPVLAAAGRGGRRLVLAFRRERAGRGGRRRAPERARRVRG